MLLPLAYFIRFINLTWEEIPRNLSRQHAVLCIVFFFVCVTILFFLRQEKLDCSIQPSLVVSISYIPNGCLPALTAFLECSIDSEESFVFVINTQSATNKAFQKAFFGEGV